MGELAEKGYFTRREDVGPEQNLGCSGSLFVQGAWGLQSIANLCKLDMSGNNVICQAFPLKKWVRYAEID